MRIEEGKVESFVGLGLIVVGFILAMLSFTGATLGKSWFFDQYAFSPQLVVGIIAVLLLLAGTLVLIFKSND